MAGRGGGGGHLQVNVSTSSVTTDSGNALGTTLGASVVESGSCVGISMRVLSKTSVGIKVSRVLLISGNSVVRNGS